MNGKVCLSDHIQVVVKLLLLIVETEKKCIGPNLNTFQHVDLVLDILLILTCYKDINSRNYVSQILP